MSGGDLDGWVERQARFSAQAMLRCVSRVDMVREKPGFGLSLRPRAGSVVASAEPGAYDPDPDYFFHWYRDSAVIMDALRVACLNGLLPAGTVGAFDDFVAFSLSLPATATAAGALARLPGVTDGYRQFLRAEADLAGVTPARVAAETRVNADGTLDISGWPRPQNDGPAARALTAARWLDSGLPLRDPDAARRLLAADIDFVLARWREPCFDIWEEELAHHYYTLRLQAAALDAALPHLDADRAEECRAAAAPMAAGLDAFREPDGTLRSRRLPDGAPAAKTLDIAIVLAAIHAGGTGPHSPADPALAATLDRLEALFDAAYAINRDRGEARGPALGRYAGDTYYSGGAYYFSTLGGAEFHFRRAAAGGPGAGAAFRRGEALLETVRVFTPASGALSEQFDQATGAQTSARHLGWSYAAFLTAAEARTVAGRRLQADAP